ncbi:hypothetical protein ACO2Q3_05345 [Caulobacter sp. KR2-114]|uniref:hypothetical protein n=1 Tax=Caulobacter sp. KR2-114 TaxID=3400912 RepID=UPI003C06C0CB
MADTAGATAGVSRADGVTDPHALSFRRIFRDCAVAFRRSGFAILAFALVCAWTQQFRFASWQSLDFLRISYRAAYATIVLNRLVQVALASLGQGAILTFAISAMDGEPIGINLADARWALLRSLRAWPPLFVFYLLMSLSRFIVPLPVGFGFDIRPLLAAAYAANGFALLLTVWIGIYPPAVVAERRSVFRGVIRADILLSGRRGRFILVMLLLGAPWLLPGPLFSVALARGLSLPALSPDVMQAGVWVLTTALGALWTVGQAAAYRECRRQREGPGAEAQAQIFD